MAIHPKAEVHKDAKIGKDVTIGAFALVGPSVAIGDGTEIMAHCCVDGKTTIGRNCKIYPYCSIGLAPQDLKWEGEVTAVTIGDDNVIREYVTVNMAQGLGEKTTIGSNNLLMAYVHVAHNCRIGSNVVMANAATLAGHVHIEDFVVLGGLVGVHQFVKIGAYAMVGGLSKIVQDIPPYMLVDGNPARTRATNAIGLKRKGFTEDQRGALKDVFRIFYRSGLATSNALEQISAKYGSDPAVLRFLEFFDRSTRGVVR